MRRVFVAVVPALLVSIGGVARADGPVEPTPRRRALAIAASIVPGAVVHGSGHFVLGDHSTARRLLIMEGVGAGLLAGGGALMAWSGTDENVALAYVPMAVTGAAIMTASFLADVLGVSIDAAPADGSAEPASLGSIGLGYRMSQVPNLDARQNARATAALRLGPVAVDYAADVATAGGYGAHEASVEWRRASRVLGGELALGVDGARYALPDDGVTTYAMSAWAEARWSLADAVPRVPGGYARLQLGLGLELIDFDGVPGGTTDDAVPFVAGRAAFGLRAGPVGLELDYDHRKDRLPGGAYLGRLPGFIGSFGLGARWRVSQRWALAGEARYGTGVTSWAGIEHHF